MSGPTRDLSHQHGTPVPKSSRCWLALKSAQTEREPLGRATGFALAATRHRVRARRVTSQWTVCSGSPPQKRGAPSESATTARCSRFPPHRLSRTRRSTRGKRDTTAYFLAPSPRQRIAPLPDVRPKAPPPTTLHERRVAARPATVTLPTRRE